ncbi:HIRAN domain-containing protein [Flectobacillus roseus]|uniref:HIRAN domain-containing protein n=1 Tax=Flectobacillus roseus TaxID=502259 RepID=UPI0024B6853D|nr:HIRAN domain-containing protein [Flectobacillus roseus]MDI9870000.1 hypothetical protein [Flectobacillus roseus]
MKKKATTISNSKRKPSSKETITFYAGIIITILSIFLVGFWGAVIVGLIAFFTLGFVSKKENSKQEKLNKTVGDARLDIPVTDPLHKFYAKYSTLYASLKDKIQENKRVCLDEYDEKNLREFCELDGLTLSNVIRPVTIDTLIAGLPYHDYKLKKVKDILDQSPYQKLQFEVEPTNPYDSKAVRIKLNEFFLGYVPQIYSSVVFDAISNNEDVSVTLYQYEKSKKIENRITVSIEIFYK